MRRSYGSHVLSTDGELCVWKFANIDKVGKFAFAVSRPDFDAGEIFEKLLTYSKMSWSEIKRQTHDGGKSKHHYLNYDVLSQAAMDRIDAKDLRDWTDAIFSFALTNKLRVIGIRKGEAFDVIWYDPNHEFCPSHKS